MRKRVTIARSPYGDQDFRVGDCVGDLRVALTKLGIPHQRLTLANCPQFAHVMNALIAQFLAQTADDHHEFDDHYLILDRDIVFRAVDALALIDSEVECVGADYAKRSLPIESSSKRNGALNGTLVGAEWMGTGFIRFKRALLDRMASRAERYRWDGLEVPELFPAVNVINREFVGEVGLFFKRLHDAGGTAWIDPSIRVGHVGTHVYELSHG